MDSWVINGLLWLIFHVVVVAFLSLFSTLASPAENALLFCSWGAFPLLALILGAGAFAKGSGPRNEEPARGGWWWQAVLARTLVLIVSFPILGMTGMGFGWFSTGAGNLSAAHKLVFPGFEYELFFWRSLPLTMLVFSISLLASAVLKRIVPAIIGAVIGAAALVAGGLLAMEFVGINPLVCGPAAALPFLLASYRIIASGKRSGWFRSLLVPGLPVSLFFLLLMPLLTRCLPPAIDRVVDSDFTSTHIALTCVMRRPATSLLVKPPERRLYLVPFTHPMGRVINRFPVGEVAACTVTGRIALESLTRRPDGLTYRTIEVGPPFADAAAKTTGGEQRFRGTSPLFAPGNGRLCYVLSDKILLRDLDRRQDIWSHRIPAGFTVSEKHFTPGGERLYVLADNGSSHLTMMVGNTDSEQPRLLAEDRDGPMACVSIDTVSGRAGEIIAKYAGQQSWWCADGSLNRRYELPGYLAGSGIWLPGNRLLWMRQSDNARGIEMIACDRRGGTFETIRSYPEYGFDFMLPNENGSSLLAGFKTRYGTRITQIIDSARYAIIGEIKQVRPLYCNGTLLILNTGHSITTFDYKTGTGFRIMDL